MQATLLVFFIVGLVLNVYFMIRGTERWGASDLAHRLDAVGRELSLGKISLRVPIIASCTSAFGLTGYLLARYTSLGNAGVLSIAFVAAGVAVTSAVLLVKKWAVPHALKDQPDERYALQGQLARVIVAIPFGTNGEGEIEYQIDDKRFTVRAHSIDGTPIAQGTDVVIERVEDGVIYVEEWARVEQRL